MPFNNADLIERLIETEVELRLLALQAYDLRGELGLPRDGDRLGSVLAQEKKPVRPAKKLASAAQAEIDNAKGTAGWAITAGKPLGEVEAQINAVKAQFEKVRTETPGKHKHKFPEWLWDMAAELASAHGVTRVAKDLGLGWMDVKRNFKRLLDAGLVSGERFPNATPARAEATDKMKASWTPERRATQAERIRNVTAKRQARLAKAERAERRAAKAAAA